MIDHYTLSQQRRHPRCLRLLLRLGNSQGRLSARRLTALLKVPCAAGPAAVTAATRAAFCTFGGIRVRMYVAAEKIFSLTDLMTT